MWMRVGSACDRQTGDRANNNVRSRAYNIRAVFFSTFLLAPPQYLTYEILTDDMFSYYTTLKNLVCVATVESSRGRRRTPRQTMIFEWKQLKSRECGGTFRRISWVMEHDKRLWGWFGVTFLTGSPINFLQVAHTFSKTNSAQQILSCKTVTQIVNKYSSRLLITFSAAHIRPYP